MEFEFDRARSDSNRAEHGTDFVEAQALWTDPDHLEIPGRDPASRASTSLLDRMWTGNRR